MTCYTTKTDAIEQCIEPALGDFADDFDMDEIFNRAFKYDEGERAFVLAVDVDGFYEIAQDCDMTQDCQK